MDTKIYSQEGKEVRNMSLPESVFGLTWNPDLVHEVVVAMQSNARAGTAHTKDRGEVRGGGKKPWRQKGTGRARHGSNRSPIWTGGGVSHGPRNERDYSKKLNKKVRAKALGITLSKKLEDGELIFVDSLTFKEPKAHEAKATLGALAKASDKATLVTKKQNAALIVLTARDEAVEKSFRNFGNIEVAQVKDVNPLDLLTYKYVIVTDPQAAIDALTARVTKTASPEAGETTN